MKFSKKLLSEYIDLSNFDITRAVNTGLEFNYLDDLKTHIEVEITPNRGDCLSIHGIARELSGCYDLTLLKDISISIPSQQIANSSILIKTPNLDVLTIDIELKQIQKVKTVLNELDKADLLSSNNETNLTNYLMLITGQPCLAIDKDKIIDKLRFEQINEYTICIKDDENIISKSCADVENYYKCNSQTKTVRLILASFDKDAITKSLKLNKINNEAGYRFSRGVCHSIKNNVLKVLSELDIKYFNQCYNSNFTLSKLKINLNIKKINSILNTNLSSSIIIDYLTRLGFTVSDNEVTVPNYRFDINNEVDLCEEVARVYGYDNIIEEPINWIDTNKFINDFKQENDLKRILALSGYNEIINFTFTSEKSFNNFYIHDGMKIKNPLSNQHSHMQVTQLSNLYNIVLNNYNNKHSKQKLFQISKCFKSYESQTTKLICIDFDKKNTREWNIDASTHDFYHFKRILTKVITYYYKESEITFVKSDYKFLSSQNQWNIVIENINVGFIGYLNENLSIGDNQFMVFEIDLNKTTIDNSIQKYKAISKFPVVERDLAFIFEEDIHSKEVVKLVESLKFIFQVKGTVFDFYNMKNGQTSIGFRFYLQPKNQTLIDSDIHNFMQVAIEQITNKFKATLRDK
jgi:phenylalanyl-tRNA synthetase beta chain